MPTWPTFTSTTLRPTRARPAARTDQRAMAALLAWRSWTRSGGEPTPAVRAADAVVAGLDERERRAVDMWLGGALDKVVAERVGMAVLLVGDVRWRVLEAVALRLAERPATARRRGRQG